VTKQDEPAGVLPPAESSARKVSGLCEQLPKSVAVESTDDTVVLFPVTGMCRIFSTCYLGDRPAQVF